MTQNHQLLSSVQPFTIVSTLDTLGYRSVTDETVAQIVSDALNRVFGKLGEQVAVEFIHDLSEINHLTEQELVRRCDLVEEAIRTLFGRAADFFIDMIKEELAPFSLTEDRKLSLEEMADRIRKAEVMRFVSNMSGHEHVGLIYNKKATKDAVLSRFFDGPTASGAQAIILLSSTKNKSSGERFEKVQNITYEEIVSGKEKSQAIDTMFKWIGSVHESNRSERETRVAGEDASWFLRNGFESEFLEAEKSVGMHVADNMSVLCSYDMGGITRSQLKKVVEAHRYIIIEQPLTVYVAPA